MKKVKLISRNIRYCYLYNPLDLIKTQERYEMMRDKFNGNLLLIPVNNYLMYIRKDDVGLSRQLLLRGKRETLATEYFLSDMEDGMTFLEIGANLGYYTIMELVNCKNSKVIAFEPNPDNFEVLEKNLVVNKVQHRVKLYNKAISNSKGKSTFYITEHSNAGSFVRQENYVEKIEVDTVKLDDVITEKVDYLRMDTEGYEYHILQGAKKLLKSKYAPRKLFIEIHPKALKRFGITMDGFLNYLLSYGYVMKKAIYQRTSGFFINERVIAVYDDRKSLMKDVYYNNKTVICFFEKR